MRIVGNILWHVLCLGFVVSLLSALVGGLLTLTVVGAPIGLGLLQYAKFALVPYSYALVDKKTLTPDAPRSTWYTVLSVVVRVLYFPFGLLFFVGGVLQVVAMCCTILLIPLAIPYAKSLFTFFNPVGKVCVTNAVAQELERRKATATVEKLQQPQLQA